MDLRMIESISTLKALAGETHFRIINLLLTHDLCVGALAAHLNMSKKHLLFPHDLLVWALLLD